MTDQLRVQDFRLLLASLHQFGPSTDGAVERDIITVYERDIAAARAEERERIAALADEWEYKFFAARIRSGFNGGM